MHSSIMSEKMLSIIAWKVAGELHIPKNITVGSKSPRFILKAAFHWSPSRIRTLLYPQQTSNFVNHRAPFNLSSSSLIRGRGYAFLIVCLLRYRWHAAERSAHRSIVSNMFPALIFSTELSAPFNLFIILIQRIDLHFRFTIHCGTSSHVPSSILSLQHSIALQKLCQNQLYIARKGIKLNLTRLPNSEVPATSTSHL